MRRLVLWDAAGQRQRPGGQRACSSCLKAQHHPPPTAVLWAAALCHSLSVGDVPKRVFWSNGKAPWSSLPAATSQPRRMYRRCRLGASVRQQTGRQALRRLSLGSTAARQRRVYPASAQPGRQAACSVPGVPFVAFSPDAASLLPVTGHPARSILCSVCLLAHLSKHSRPWFSPPNNAALAPSLLEAVPSPWTIWPPCLAT